MFDLSQDGKNYPIAKLVIKTQPNLMNLHPHRLLGIHTVWHISPI